MLLRRFFALFGIRLEPVPTLANAPEVPSLTCPVLAIPPTAQAEEAPPSYQDATKSVTTIPSVQHAKAVQKDSKWRIGSLLNRSKSGHHLSDKEAASRSTEGYASTSSDEWTASEEKILLRKNGISPSGTSPSVLDTSSRGHMTTPSIKASVAQLALSKPKLLVLDLDETLIHSTSRMNYASGAVTSSVDGRSTWNANTSGLKVRVVEVVLDGRSVIYHVYKRPWVDFFLRKVSSWYTVVIFTASLQEYADPVIDWLDQGSGMISSRLFRESCTYVNGSYLKDLSIVDKDLARVCLVDNSPVSYAINPGKHWLSACVTCGY
jgi:Dullard-like phosphatase family protein